MSEQSRIYDNALKDVFVELVRLLKSLRELVESEVKAKEKP